MSTNHAAFLTQPMSRPLVVGDAPFPTPNEDEIVVKNAYVGINGVDYKLQEFDWMNMKYPTILGAEVAGKVVAVGPLAKEFQVGDRVIGFCHFFVTGNSRNAGFQEYTVLISSFATRIPDGMPLKSAVVLPVTLCTAATALFTEENLALPLSVEQLLDPSKQDSGSSSGTVLIWGGSSGVGCSTIQLARAAGLRVVTTASKQNWDLCKSLGAREVFDRNSDSVVDDIVAALQGRPLIGAVNAIGTPDTLQACVDVLVKTESRKFIGNTIPVDDSVDLKGVKAHNFHAYKLLQGGLASKFWKDFLPQALEKGIVVPKPDAVVVGKGLEDIQSALDTAKKSHSASKLIVALEDTSST